MATQAMPGQETAVVQAKRTPFSGRRGSKLRESLTAYLFLAPAAFIIFTFGIFPIFYAAYVSLYKWRIKQGEYLGLENYIVAMGDAAYVFFAILTLVALTMGVTYALRGYRQTRKHNIPSYFLLLNLIPGGLIAYGMAQILLRLVTFFSQIDAIDKGHAEVLGSVPYGLLFVAIGMAVSMGINQWQHKTAAKSEHSLLPSLVGTGIAVVVAFGLAFVLGRFTYEQLLASNRYGLALIRTGLMAGGIIILAVAYFVWSWAMRQHSTLKTILGLFGATAFIGAGVFFSVFWPTISKGADPRFYLSLQVTVFYSLGTVPVQLAIAMVLAYLLFQPIKGKALFRIIFFIPYIAPAVATAGIFQVLFSLRTTSIANQIISKLSFGQADALSWLKEPNSALAILGQAFGIESASNWTFGPSLALAVIIMYNIWVFVGYNTVIFLAGLGNIPSVLYEAAELDGAGRWALFRHVTLPLLSPITFFLSVLAVIGTFKAFTHVWVLRDAAALGTTDTSSIYFFEQFFRGARFGYATSMAIVLFVIILALTIIQNRLAERRVFYG